MAITTNIFVVAAMAGNFWVESGINPGIYEGLRVVPLTDNSVYGGYGIGQWTNAPRLGVTRRTELIEWLRANGYDDDSADGQLNFLIYENTWYRNGYGARFNSLSDFFASSSNELEILTYAWMQGWEGIWNGTQNERVQHAYQCLEYIQSHTTHVWIEGEKIAQTFDDYGDEWFTGNRYLSVNERLHNALMLYNWMTDSEPQPPDPIPPDPPEPGKRTSKMPIWMYVRYHL